MPTEVAIGADAFRHRVHAEAAGQFAHAFDRFLATLADDIGRAELLRQFDAIFMAAHDDDLLGAQAFRGDHAAQADRAVADHRCGLAAADARDDCRVMSGAHHVGQSEQRRHERAVLA